MADTLFKISAIFIISRLLNVDGITEKIQDVLEKLRAPINKGIDYVLNLIIKAAKAVIKGGKAAVDKLLEWWQEKKEFKAKDGSDHELYYKGKGKSAVLYVASHNPRAIKEFIAAVGKKKMDSNQKTAFDSLKSLYPQIEGFEDKLENKKSTNKQKDYSELQGKLNDAVGVLSVLLPLVDYSDKDVPKAIMPAFTNGVRAQSFEAMYITKEQPKQTPKGKPSTANNGQTLPGWLQLFQHNNPKTNKPVGANNAFEKTHLLHEKLGGDATDSNLIPASNSVNKNFRPMEKAAIDSMNAGEKLWYKINIEFHNQNPKYGVKGIDYSGYVKNISGSYGHLEANDKGQWQKQGTQADKINISSIPIPYFGSLVIHNLNEMSDRGLTKLTDGHYSISVEMAKFIYEDRMRKKSKTTDGKRRHYSENTPFSGWSGNPQGFLERMEARATKGTVNVPSDYDEAIGLLTDLQNKGQIKF